MNKRKYLVYKWLKYFSAFVVFLTFPVIVIAQSTQQNELQSEEGQLKIDVGRLNKEVETQSEIQAATGSKYGITLFAPDVAVAYANYHNKTKQQREKDKATLFLVKYPEKKPKYATLFQHAPTVTNSNAIDTEQYVDMSYFIYVFIALFGGLLIFSLCYIGKKELSQTVEEE